MMADETVARTAEQAAETAEAGELLADDELSLLETLDHVLNRGLVIAGEVTISVADIDMVFLGLNLFLSSVETVEEILGERDARVAALRERALRLTPTGGEREGGA